MNAKKITASVVFALFLLGASAQTNVIYVTNTVWLVESNGVVPVVSVLEPVDVETNTFVCGLKWGMYPAAGWFVCAMIVRALRHRDFPSD